MITQIEVSHGQSVKTYWVKHNPFDGERLSPGQQVILAEEGTETPWLIKRTFVSIPDGREIPVPHRLGTLLEILNA